MKSESSRHLAAFSLLVFAALVFTFPVQCQEQAYEYGQIVQTDERGEALEFLDESQEAAEKRLPWIPVLSPTMICLDCWITKTVKIHQFYSQQAAERYFAEAETCADLALSHDPCIGTGLKYTLLAPFYAGCPDLLYNGGFWGWMRMKCGGGFGMGAGYGIDTPMPSPAMEGPAGAQLMAPPPAPGTGGTTPLMPPAAEPVGSESVKMLSPTGEGSVNTASAGGASWSQMSDTQILAYFGLDANGVTVGEKLSEPVERTGKWEFADEAKSTPALDMVAMAQTPVTDTPAIEETKPVVTKKAETSSEPESEPVTEEPKKETKSFSVTDEEYDKMREIEQDLLGSL